MKLLNILAVELREWPEGVAAITQGTWSYALRDSSFQPIIPIVNISQIADDAGNHSYIGGAVTRAEWQAAVDALARKKYFDEVRKEIDIKRAADPGGTFVFGHVVYRQHKQPEWSEDGLPNVGTKCVVYKGSYNLLGGQENFIGPVVTVTARFKSARGVEMACVDSGTGLGCHLFRADMCFHLPTAEEIAAEEREKSIQSMRDEIGYRRTQLGPCPVEKLYDANYRKQVTK